MLAVSNTLGLYFLGKRWTLNIWLKCDFNSTVGKHMTIKNLAFVAVAALALTAQGAWAQAAPAPAAASGSSAAAGGSAAAGAGAARRCWCCHRWSSSVNHCYRRCSRWSGCLCGFFQQWNCYCYRDKLIRFFSESMAPSGAILFFCFEKPFALVFHATATNLGMQFFDGLCLKFNAVGRSTFRSCRRTFW